MNLCKCTLFIRIHYYVIYIECAGKPGGLLFQRNVLAPRSPHPTHSLLRSVLGAAVYPQPLAFVSTRGPCTREDNSVGGERALETCGRRGR